ncbi:MAG: hypothetical protein JW751_14995 [Polyangiaceae bacterium]|nr:hypothetical protein [Polyangiaceae bacterium]
MTEHNDFREAAAKVLDTDDVEGVLSARFYAGAPARQERVRREQPRPSHYKVICISMYTEDLQHLDEMVEVLKARGLTKANRSALIRYALGEVDLDRVPRGL